MMGQGLKNVSLEKEGLLYHLKFEIPHTCDGRSQDGINVTISADENTPTWAWMGKLKLACLSVVTLIETKNLDKREKAKAVMDLHE